MTGNEPGSTGSDQLGDHSDEERRKRHGNMHDAEDRAAGDVSNERAQNAAAGDTRAQAEQAGKPDRLRHAAEWPDGTRVPKLGQGDVGAFGDESEDSVRSHDGCPLCGHPMGKHTIDRYHASAVLNCPVPPNPEVQSFEPLNEVGMVKRAPEDKDKA